MASSVTDPLANEAQGQVKNG